MGQRDLSIALLAEDRMATACAHLALAAILGPLGDYASTRNHSSQALDISRSIGDLRLAKMAQMILGEVKFALGDLEGALDELQNALALAPLVRDSWTEAEILESLGVNQLRLGRPELAATLLEEALSTCKRCGDEIGGAHVVSNQAILATDALELRRSAELLRDALRVYRRTGIGFTVAEIFGEIALVAALSERCVEACQVLAIEAETRQAFGFHREPFLSDRITKATSICRHALGNDAFAANWQRARRLPRDQAIDQALAIATSLSERGDVTAPPKSSSSAAALTSLSPRERAVLNLLLQRFTDKEIAVRLCISPRTVQRHTANIFNKLGVNSRREAAAVIARSADDLPKS